MFLIKQKKRKIFIFVIVCVSVLTLFVVFEDPAVILSKYRHYFVLSNKNEPLNSLLSRRRMQIGDTLVKDLNVCAGKRLVLYWTKFFEVDDFNVGFGNEPFERCVSSSCCSTKNRSLIHQSDAVVFHIRDLVMEDMPSRRWPHQRWIFYLLESPLYTPNNILKHLGGVFNWTMTYRVDSDIHFPYADPFVEKMRKSYVESEMTRQHDATATLEHYSKLQSRVGGKTKLVAWFVSNCFSTSGRERYASQLEKYVHVDVYGQCGSLTCLDRTQCSNVIRDYKFYLAFENSICRDYITEKFYNALLFETVPIVYGGGNYSVVAPKGSYIDIRDFPSVESLAEFLNFLDRNHSAYMRYFEWRQIPNAMASLPTINRGWCTLCSMLVNNASSLPPSYYSNIHAWWFEKGECQIYNNETSLIPLH